MKTFLEGLGESAMWAHRRAGARNHQVSTGRWTQRTSIRLAEDCTAELSDVFWSPTKYQSSSHGDDLELNTVSDRSINTVSDWKPVQQLSHVARNWKEVSDDSDKTVTDGLRLLYPNSRGYCTNGVYNSSGAWTREAVASKNKFRRMTNLTELVRQDRQL